MIFKSRIFGNVYAVFDGVCCSFEIDAKGRCSESQLNDLAENIRSAQCWLRDVRRRQSDNETPELPME